MSETQNHCPFCGETNIQKFEQTVAHRLVLGNEFIVPESFYKCTNCESEFADEAENEKRLSAALVDARKVLSGTLIEKIKVNGLSMAYVERAFELPIRTLNRWKSAGETSAASLAFLRLISTYPWLVDVADCKFDQRAAGLILWREALKAMSQYADENGGDFSCHGIQNSKETGIYTSLTFKNDEDDYQLTG